ncbi:hypothetical protein F5Y15DRAFT_430660 [Xylariaceae sp. FL0016]|nr:hypothetical protein F5Y15DRAFT_430660 [Xylariaceae sp. FL0016]
MSSTGSPSTGPPLQLSPWAERFGYDSNPFHNEYNPKGQRSSGINPEPPETHPVFYEDPIQPPDEPTRSNAELDRFYHGLVNQERVNMGLHSPMAAALNGVLDSSPTAQLSGGHLKSVDRQANLDTYKNLRIEVDETRWFPFFRKELWYDVGDPMFTEDSTRKWSVDDAGVWENLRFTLELADRILKMLIEDKDEW